MTPDKEKKKEEPEVKSFKVAVMRTQLVTYHVEGNTLEEAVQTVLVSGEDALTIDTVKTVGWKVECATPVK